MKDLNFYIGIPCYGNSLSVNTFESIMGLTKHFLKNNIKFDIHTLGQESLIPRGRNFMSAKMMSSEKRYTHLLFIDADIGFRIENILRLIDFDKEIVCGVYPRKKIEWQRLSNKIRSENINDKNSLFLNSVGFAVDFENPRDVKTVNGFAKLKYGATGAMLVKRTVFEKLQSNYPELQYESDHNNELMFDFFQTGIVDDNGKNKYISEDYYFCHLWKKLGGEIWGDLASGYWHFGQYNYYGSVLSTAKKNKNI